MFKTEKGITLIALIITIIVMLVLVGVTINVAVNGGLFEKGEKAAYQTNVATIKEKLAIKKAEVLADHNGKSQDDYGITFADLELTGNLDDFKTKLTISKDGTLYYIEDEVNDKEKGWLAELGITAGVEGTENPVIGIYYAPAAFSSQTATITVNENEIEFPVVGGTTQKIEYIFENSQIKAAAGTETRTLNFHTIGNTKILSNEEEKVFVATNRTGLEGPESLNGTYTDEGSNTLTIDRNAGTLTYTINGSTTNPHGYYYYENKIYTGSGKILGTYNSTDDELEVIVNDNTYTFGK